VIYLERTPAAPLNQCIRLLWYTEAPNVPHTKERILPTGSVQVILNLARDFIQECYEEGRERRLSPSLIVGARSKYEIVHTADMACLIGIIFHHGGFAPFSSYAVDDFTNQNISLEDVWGAAARALRDRLREASTPHKRLRTLENYLLDTFAPRFRPNRMVDFALSRFRQAPMVSTVAEVAEATGWTERHFSQTFREHVGLSPKVWCRIQRFQRAVQQLHAGADIRWADLALECGFYDQSHFANEFRGFSGIDVSSYFALRGRWANHVPADTIPKTAGDDFRLC
jgi:AraC-like DNA-binding protein